MRDSVSDEPHVKDNKPRVRTFSTKVRAEDHVTSRNGEGPRQRIEQFFDAATDAIIFLDREYRVTYLNRRAKEVLAPSGDVMGTNLFESFPGVVYEGSPYVENYRRAMDEGLSGEFEAYYGEPLNLWLRVQSYPADDGIIIYFRDFTREKNAIEALRKERQEAERQHNEIETVYRTAPIGLALFDTKDFRYLRLNDRQAEFFGLKPEQIVGRTLTEMAPIDGLRQLFEQVLEGRPVVNHLLEGEVVSSIHCGTDCTFALTISPSSIEAMEPWYSSIIRS